MYVERSIIFWRIVDYSKKLMAILNHIVILNIKYDKLSTKKENFPFNVKIYNCM